MLKFQNTNAFNKIKNLWYTNNTNEDGTSERKLIKNGYYFKDTYFKKKLIIKTYFLSI